MNAEERQVIDDIFRRLEQVANQPRDPEAERYIAEKLRQQPYAPYALAQSVFVQEQAIANMSRELEQLRAEGARQPASGGFLSSLFGGGRQPEPSRPGRGGSPWDRPGPMGGPQGYPQGGHQGGPMAGGPMGGGPMGGGPWGGMQPRGGGFLQGALATAAGVAGGMMIANALTSAFSGENGASGEASSLAGLDQGGAAAGGETSGITDGLYQDASAQDQDFGGDAGDGGDWA